MLTTELGAGNLANPVTPEELRLGKRRHMLMRDKIRYETFLQQFGFDPPKKYRMDFALLAHNEVLVRTKLMLLLKQGHNWGSAMDTMQVTLETHFFLKNPYTDEEKTAKKVEALAAQNKALMDAQNSLKAKLAQKGTKGAGKGGPKGDKKGSWQGGYGAWGTGNQASQYQPYAPTMQYLEKDTATGKYYCRKLNRNVPHDASQCQYLHQCSWLHCPNRATCPGAYMHDKTCPPTGPPTKGKGKKGKGK